MESSLGKPRRRLQEGPTVPEIELDGRNCFAGTPPATPLTLHNTLGCQRVAMAWVAASSITFIGAFWPVHISKEAAP